jgi:three-Cys-motif partner protein
MDTSQYIKKRVRSLTEDSQEVRDVSPVTNDFDTWSALKLILHSAAVNMYTNVLESNEYFNDLFYIDALAGSGVSTYGDEDRCLLGSPIIAAKVAEEPFKKMYLIEKNEDKAKALEQRMQHIFNNHADVPKPKEYDVIIGDANEELPRIARDIWKIREGGFNYFCFIDNQELNVKWEAIDALTPKPYGDFLINLPTSSGIGRNATKRPVPDGLNEFYCMDLNECNIPQSGVRPKMKELYKKCLKKNGRPIQRMTNVDANVGSYEYDLLYATRKTDGGSGYVEVVEYVSKFIEDVHAGDIDNILDVIYNNQSSLTQHLPDGDIDDKIPDQEDDCQSAIDEFL